MTRIIIRAHTRKSGNKRVHVRQHTKRIPKKYKHLKRGPPKLPLIKTKFTKTIYLQDPKTGLMIGRKRVPGIGDRTRTIMDKNTSRIFGRLPKPKGKKK